MPSIRLTLAVLCAGFATQGAWAACYVVYGADKQVVYRAQTPPVDMSRDLHETLPQVAPGGTLVFSLSSEGCELEVHRLPEAARAQPARPAARQRPAERR
ncbi:hypothetical protein [Acidovorax sp. MR-S7]|jgi:hypothetical protein|uniref:hypothetical protein n=1 Tax=Acidovorax sp. MR-S7 TaxID=1268622 RepID=UPI00035FC7DE|nr:hypothetical protein [Acidovorax sp. MR-S7]GAD22175.1 hypothetical protein AVS7_01935 [Acidovorax sp. MR-S7]